MSLEGSALQRASALLAHVRERPPVVAVIGDLILDSWWLGEAERVTREAPAPVLRLEDVVDVAGGATIPCTRSAVIWASCPVTSARSSAGELPSRRRSSASISSADRPAARIRKTVPKRSS